MGLFSRRSEGGGDRTFRKHAERVANKRAQAPDRFTSIEYFAQLRTAEAREALVARFTYSVEPTITDADEKDACFDAVVSAGDASIEPARRFLRRAQSLSWPLRILAALRPDPEFVGEVCAFLASFDTEYEKNPERKTQAISTLAERRDPAIAPAVLRFLEDRNEPVRFHAVACLLAQFDAEAPEPAEGTESDRARQALLDRLVREESVRVRVAIAEGVARVEWNVRGYREKVEAALPPGFLVERSGVIKKR